MSVSLCPGGKRVRLWRPPCGQALAHSRKFCPLVPFCALREEPTESRSLEGALRGVWP